MIFDAHCHIIEAGFPLTANNGYLPPAFGTQAYLAQADVLGVKGGAVVSGSFQGFDQTYLVAALARLGEGFVGVTQLPAEVGDAEILRLDAQRVRALRFNLKRGGSESLHQLERMALRVHALAGWHVELYVDARDLPDLEACLLRLPAVSIDHLGLSREGLPHLLRLAERGVHVKACGFGRVDFDVASALRDIHTANPLALMFGTDLPSTRAPRAFQPEDVQLVKDALGETAAQAVLWDNGRRFYRL